MNFKVNAAKTSQEEQGITEYTAPCYDVNCIEYLNCEINFLKIFESKINIILKLYVQNKIE